jgi:Protein phosphatase 2C
VDALPSSSPPSRSPLPWRVHGVSVEGYRHRRSGVGCQDAWYHAAARDARNPVTVLAVADGAGSRARSDEGSALAVRLAAGCFADRLTERPRTAGAVHEALRAAFRDVRTEFLRVTGAEAHDFATTLTVVVLAPSWLGHLTVGDGFVVLRAGTHEGVRQYHLLPQPASVSEYSNETVFLTSDSAERSLRTDCVRDPGIDGILVSTDGLAQVALTWFDGRPLRPRSSFAASVLRTLDTPGPEGEDEEAIAALLRSDALTAVNADDKTLLRAVRR